MIIRHAKAARRGLLGFLGKKDALRPLTDAGRKDMRRVAKALHALEPDVGVLASSPFVRARETAEIVAGRYADLPVTELAALAPGGAREELLAWLREQRPSATVALVGHEPDLGLLASWLLSGGRESFVRLKKGAACLIEMDATPAAGTTSCAAMGCVSESVRFCGAPPSSAHSTHAALTPTLSVISAWNA